MAVSYKKLFHMLIEKDMTPAQLQHQAGFSANIIARMKRNGYLSLETISWTLCGGLCFLIIAPPAAFAARKICSK